MSLSRSGKSKFLTIAYIYIIKNSFITFGLFILHAHTCGGQKTTFGSWFCPWIVWALGTECRHQA